MTPADLIKVDTSGHIEKKNGLSQQELISLLTYSPETGLFHWKGSKNHRVKNGSVAGSIDSSGHIQIKIFKRSYLAHRLAWLYMHGSWPVNQIDHINGNKLDNALSNLRDVDSQKNSENKRKALSSNKTSGLLGVCWHKASKSWMASIKINGKTKYLGSFNDPSKAHEVYLSNKRLLHKGCTI